MSISVPKIVEEKIALLVKNGRGQGVGKDYKPWIRTQDFYSEGKMTRWWSMKQNRMMETFSNGETTCGRLLLWPKSVRDVREQFPLFPLELTLEIAAELGVEHPSDSRGLPIVMTTDFRVDVEVKGKFQTIHRTYKPTDLLTDRNLEKLEIERVFAGRTGVDDWGLVTESDLPEDASHNVEFLGDFQVAPGPRALSLAGGVTRLRTLVVELLRRPNVPVCEICECADAQDSSPYEVCSLGALNTAFGNDLLPIDITERYEPNRPLQPRSLSLLRGVVL